MNTYQHFRLMIDEANAIDTVEHPVDIDNSLRFKLFQARKENLSVFKDYRRVPPYDYLVRKDRTVFQVIDRFSSPLVQILFVFLTEFSEKT